MSYFSMMRARCAACHWEFDLCALPMPLSNLQAFKRAPCPICGNAKGNTLAKERDLTPAESVQKARALAERDAQMTQPGGK